MRNKRKFRIISLLLFCTGPVAAEIDDRQCWECHKAGQTAENAPAVNQQTYAASIHGGSSCLSCHSDIVALPHPPKLKPVDCTGCHDSATESFQSSLHALATARGLRRAPTCATCHGTHDITGCTEADGVTRHANLTLRCRICHRGAEAHWPMRPMRIHAPAGSRPPQPTAVRCVQGFYLTLIAVLASLMLLHNGLDLIRKLRRGKPVACAEKELRLTIWMRVQHFALIVSFATLAYTGFARRAPDAWWTLPLRAGSRQDSVASRLHHAAGVAFATLLAVHLATALGTRRGRRHLRELLFKREDWDDLVATMLHNLRGCKPRPQRRWSYVEKFEYWSVLVGGFITSVTGLAMLGGETVLRFAGPVWCELAWTIHYYEACLATLCVLLWHLYAVIINPDVFPMNPAWLSGYRLTRSRTGATSCRSQ
ncbi:MAG: cytochrome b/b6 domain-containing protein [Verrucomicrobiae bacterium]|nr:cytochrome b/b6 domain-containing protein [Verrucomicrobiae bacterium]